ncbi:alpha/beta hydrolase [Streptomyces iconiensis]|uniref:Alpha/beta hydrolase n=1 Tax=Streptomyces iconiensis TaxID=1384038 RepID=A0ABT6ZQE3_9ACTN|nr:alpha/beta hydrolase [Streptomyces iconiensis]MDJ1131268.1 alpha/beta hydrolase [Streptomyces iconiensis]
MPHHAARPIASDEFFTCRHPEDYHPDWKGFYEAALARRDEVRALIPHADEKYGPDPSHLANVYFPEKAQGSPVIVYFHGGRWREGHPAFYDHLALPWVRAGAVFISCGYRLEPRHTIADAVHDAALAVTWSQDVAARYGGDPERVVVAGHSAGGHLAAMVTMTDWPTAPKVPVAGVVCMSTPADLGPDAAGMSPARRVTRCPQRVVISYGVPEPNKKGQDGNFFADQGRSLAKAVEDAGSSPVVVEMQDTDHVASATAFAEPGSSLFAAAESTVFA